MTASNLLFRMLSFLTNPALDLPCLNQFFNSSLDTFPSLFVSISLKTSWISSGVNVCPNSLATASSSLVSMNPLLSLSNLAKISSAYLSKAAMHWKAYSMISSWLVTPLKCFAPCSLARSAPTSSLAALTKNLISTVANFPWN